MSPSPDQTRTGLLYAVAAYGSWALLPVFWKQLGTIPAQELLAHRLLWSAVLLVGLVLWRRQLPLLRTALQSWRTARWFILSALLIGTNYGTFIYAVVSDHIVDASLGYFITPLVNVALGAFVLGERLRPQQHIALLAALCGVAIMAMLQGGLPWISILLAGSFGTYGLVRKQSPTDALVGSALELTVLALPAFAAIAYLASTGEGAVGAVTPWLHVLLLLTGAVTALPLLWFTEGARRLPLTTLGFVQYLAPTGQLLLGVWWYGEPFSLWRGVAFGFIWMGISLFSHDLWSQRHDA